MINDLFKFALSSFKMHGVRRFEADGFHCNYV